MNERTYLPVLLDITDKNILVIGAGRAGSEKLRSLGQTGKTITVISPEFRDEFLDRDWIKTVKRPYQSGDLDGFDIVYVAVNDETVSKQIQDEAKDKRLLLNFVDRPSISHFISPSVLIRKFFSIFVSTYGRGPGMTKRIRQTLEEKLDLDDLDRQAEEYILERERNRQQ